MARHCDNDRRRRQYNNPTRRARRQSTSYDNSDGNWKRRRINALAESSEEDDGKESEVEDSYSSEEQDNMIKNLALGHKRKGKSSDPLLLKMLVNNISVTMEIDCGAAYSVISQETYLKYFAEKKLEPVVRRLSVITGESIEVLGEMEVEVKFTKRIYPLTIIVIKTYGTFRP